MSAAQDEFDALFADKDRSSRHPEDEAAASPSSESEADEPEPYTEKLLDEDEPPKDNMRARYYLPRLRSDANTGPKGVIADAQAFEQAKRAQRLTFLRSNEKSTYTSHLQPGTQNRYHDDERGSGEDDDDDEFMQQWRQSRLKELQKREMRSRSRTVSPGKGTYGILATVDAEGYLDAIEEASADTVVVVLIYDDTSEVSALVEDCVKDLARKHATTRFVKLHYEEAEMEEAGVPALLAYKGGDKFAGLVPVVDEIPDDAELSASALEAVLKRYHVLF